MSYHNTNDFWLATGWTALDPVSGSALEVNWVKNHEAYKPDDRYGPGHYTYDPLLNWARFWRGISFNRTVLDSHERMSFVSRSRTSALGASPEPPGFSGVNLAIDYGFATPRPDHSGQFQRPIQLMYGKEDGTPWVNQIGEAVPLYRQLMKDLEVVP